MNSNLSPATDLCRDISRKLTNYDRNNDYIEVLVNLTHAQEVGTCRITDHEHRDKAES